jgi:uncharacterized protein (TIGR00251 family)
VTIRVIQVRVKTRARRSTIVAEPDGTWRVELKSPPVDGKANQDLIALVSEHFGCPKSAVSIKSGASSRTKLVVIDAPVTSG